MKIRDQKNAMDLTLNDIHYNFFNVPDRQVPDFAVNFMTAFGDTNWEDILLFESLFLYMKHATDPERQTMHRLLELVRSIDPSKGGSDDVIQDCIDRSMEYFEMRDPDAVAVKLYRSWKLLPCREQMRSAARLAFYLSGFDFKNTSASDSSDICSGFANDAEYTGFENGLMKAITAHVKACRTAPRA